MKKRTSTWLKVTKPLLLSCPIPLFFYFLFYIIIYTIFTIYDTVYGMNDAKDTTNFTTYVLQIDMSPIKKNNF